MILNTYDVNNNIFINPTISNGINFILKDNNNTPINSVGLLHNFYIFSSVSDTSNIALNLFSLNEPDLSEATQGIVKFSFEPADWVLPGNDYYYLFTINDSTLVNTVSLSGHVKVLNSISWTSGLDWKPDAVSGQLGEVFNYSQTSGLVQYAGGPVYKDEITGVILIFSHAEEGYWLTGTPPSIGHKSSIRLKVSLDNGETLYDAGEIITPKFQALPTGDNQTTATVDILQNAIFCMKRGDYLYLYYYSERSSDIFNIFKFGHICLARARYSEVISSALNKTVCSWKKLYNNDFTEDGLGGDFQDLSPVFEISPSKITGFYSSKLNKIVILYINQSKLISTNVQIAQDVNNLNRNIYALVSDDGINFSPPYRLTITDTPNISLSVLSDTIFKGIVNDSAKIIATSGSENPSLVDVIAYELSAVNTPDRFRSYSVERYTPSYKVKYSLDRGQLHPYMAVIHNLIEQSKYLEASAYLYANSREFILHNEWYNIVESYSNSSTDFINSKPSSIQDYANFKFGRDFHKLYEEYSKTFKSHSLGSRLVTLDGPNVISHSFGPLIYNANLELQGSASLQYKNLITSDIDNIVTLNVGHPIFSSGAGASGTFISSSLIGNDYISDYREYRNSAILSHIEFCQTSATSKSNSFSIIDVEGSPARLRSRRSGLLNNNVLIKQKSVNGFGRVIFNLNKYEINNQSYSCSSNFLIPDHEFELSFKALISSEDGLTVGNGSIGVWIHTMPELGKIHSFVNGSWVSHNVSSLSINNIINKYSNLVTFKNTTRTESNSKFECAKFLDLKNENRSADVLKSFSQSEFNDIKIKFNTKNKLTKMPLDYTLSISNNFHRLNQKYVIEVFTLPSNNNNYSLYYNFNMIDLTLNKMAKPFITGIPNGSVMGEKYCKEFRATLTKDQLLTVFKYFNQIRGDYVDTTVDNFTGYASRSPQLTEDIYYKNGGSRINYVESPVWSAENNSTSTNQIEKISIMN